MRSPKFKIAPRCSNIPAVSPEKSYVRRNSACIFAINTVWSKGFAMKSSPPIFMAMTIFILSAAEERKIIGTFDILRISLHQWYPLKQGSPISNNTRWGAAAANSDKIWWKFSTHTPSRSHFSHCPFITSAMALSSSTMKMQYFIQDNPFFLLFLL